jgi:AraC-like DNA-binding protein
MDLRLLDDPENRVPLAQAAFLADECERATGCRHIGLLIGQRGGVAALGPIAEAARLSGRVSDALQAYISRMHLLNRGAAMTVRARSVAEIEFVHLVYHRDMRGGRHISDAALALALAFMQGVCGPQWRPAEVTFPNSRPASVTPYRRCFGAPLRFDAPHAALVFPAKHLDLPVAHHGSPDRERLAQVVADMESARPASLTVRTREELSRMLVDAPPSVDAVARALGLSRRTLNRQLAAGGTSVRALLEEVRGAMGRQLLEETQMPISEIAATLHYTTPNAFARAFSRWSGNVSPRQCRARARLVHSHPA